MVQKCWNMVPLEYLGNFWKTREIQLINLKINFILTWFKNSVLIPDGINVQI